MERLLSQLDEAFDRTEAWHGPNLLGSLRGLAAEDAGFRPAPQRHNIAEVVIHAAYWKNAVRARVRGEGRTFPLPGEDWFAVSEPLTEENWREFQAILQSEHRALREAVATFPEARLSDLVPDGKTTYETIIAGIAFHDVYHAGQIQLLKALAKA